MIATEKKTEVLWLEAIGLTRGEIATRVNISIKSVHMIVNDRKRILTIGDLHCGHESGLTPPDWQDTKQQEEIWKWYSDRVKSLGADILFCMGDMMDGKGKRSGGTELIEPTWKGQIDMAAECIRETGCKVIIMVYGTGYHVGDEEDYEGILASQVGAKIKSHAFPVVNGIQFDLKHRIGSSSVPHGRSTAIKKERLWNVLWHMIEGQPVSQVFLRGHTHYYDATGNAWYKAIICPALQGWGSKYGERQCSGIVNTGLIWFDIRKGDTIQTMKYYVDCPQFATHKVDIIAL